MAVSLVSTNDANVNLFFLIYTFTPGPVTQKVIQRSDGFWNRLFYYFPAVCFLGLNCGGYIRNVAVCGRILATDRQYEMSVSTTGATNLCRRATIATCNFGTPKRVIPFCGKFHPDFNKYHLFVAGTSDKKTICVRIVEHNQLFLPAHQF